MKVQVFPVPPVVTPPERVVCLKLEPEGESVRVIMVNQDGSGITNNFLAEFRVDSNNKLTLYRAKYANVDLVSRDSDMKIVISEV